MDAPRHRPDRLTTLVEQVDGGKKYITFCKRSSYVIFGLLLINTVVFGGDIVHPVLVVLVLLFGGILIARHKVKSAATTYTNLVTERVEEFQSSPHIDASLTRSDPPENQYRQYRSELETAAGLASQVKDADLQRQVSEARVYLDREWIVGQLRLASRRRAEADSDVDSENTAEAIEKLQRAILAYDHVENTLVEGDDGIFYDPAVAAAVGINVPPDELTSLSEVGIKRADRLRSAGYGSLRALRDTEPKELANIDSIGEKTAQRILSSVRKYPIKDQLARKRETIENRIATLEAIPPTQPEEDTESGEESQTKVGGNEESADEIDTEPKRDDRLEKEPEERAENEPEERAEEVVESDTGVVSDDLPVVLRSIDVPADATYGELIVHAAETLDRLNSGDDRNARLIRAHNQLCTALGEIETEWSTRVDGILEAAISVIEDELGVDAEQDSLTTADTKSIDERASESRLNTTQSATDSVSANQSRQKPTKEELIGDLHRIDQNTEGEVSRGTVWATGRFDPEVYEQEFGSWENALEAAGVNSQREESTETTQDDSEATHEDDLLSIPEGRIPELDVTVVEITDGDDGRRDLELAVETADGHAVPLTIWSKHEIPTRWRKGEQYRLKNARHQVWESEGRRQDVLSSTRAFSAELLEDSIDEKKPPTSNTDRERDTEERDGGSNQSGSDIVDKLLDDLQFEDTS